MTNYIFKLPYKLSVSLTVPELENPERLLSRSSLRNTIVLKPGEIVDLSGYMEEDPAIQELMKGNYLIKQDSLTLVDVNQLFKDNDTGFMVLAALRYCHGRMTYAPSLMVEWVKKYWEQLGDNTQELIRKETREYMQSTFSKGMECDRLTWESFAQWIEEN